jgi:RNA polymerase sigma-70 factor (ECF subfamily)
VTAAELRQILNTFVASLEDTDRKLFVGRYFHCYTPRQLSHAYGMKENALNQRLYRIRERLRVYLSERGYHV